MQGQGHLLKVEGVEGIKRLPDQSLAISAEQLAEAQKFFIEREAARQAAAKGSTDAVVPIATAPTVDGKETMRERLRSHGMTPTEDPDVLWNFEKFLIGRDGRVISRFAPPVKPDDPEVLEAIDAALAQ